jgi:hypothetical protein
MNDLQKPWRANSSARWLPWTLALAAGLLGANSFSTAAGFPPASNNSPNAEYGVTCWVISAVVLGFLTFTLTKYLFGLGERLFELFSVVHDRPVLPVTITFLVCGTLCVLGALGLSVADGPPSVTLSHPAMRVPGPEFAPFSAGAPSITALLIRPLVTILSLLVGTALMALGVWASLKPASERVKDEG